MEAQQVLFEADWHRMVSKLEDKPEKLLAMMRKLFANGLQEVLLTLFQHQGFPDLGKPEALPFLRQQIGMS